MEEEITQQEETDTQHQPHKDAKKRLSIGVSVVALLAILLLIWAVWGDTILETCFGKEVCAVELPEAE